jgi:ABC-type multidrug transport system fused ATPase/permease subunit
VIKRLIFRFLPPQWRRHVRQYRRLNLHSGRAIGMVMLLGTIAIVFETVGVTMILPIVEYIQSGGAIDRVGGGSKIWMAVKDLFAVFGQPVTLGGLCLAVFILILLRQIASYAFLVSQTTLKHAIGRELGMRAFSAILNSKAAYIRSIGQGSFVNVVDHQSQATAMIVRCYVTIAQLALTAATYLGVMVVSAPLTSMAAIGVVVVALTGMGRLATEGRNLSKKIIDQRNEVATFLNERYSAWRLIKTFGTLDRESQKADQLSQDFSRMSVDLVRQVGRIQLVVGTLLAGMALAIIYMAVRYLDTTASTLALFLIILVRLIPVAQAMAGQRHSIALCEASLDFMVDHLDKARASKDVDRGGLEFSGLKQSIVLKNLRYQYPGTERPALDGVSATFHAGELTALVGPSGAGKSTLADLLPRIIDPDSGTIEMDGRPAMDYSLSSIRRHIAYVSQDTVLLSGSVRDNVCYGNPQATDKEVEQACRRAFAHDFIVALPNGYATILGADGIDLSGGQKQRLALARALLMRSSIIILDEPTSALDMDSETKIREAIEALRREHSVTFIVIAHRLSFVRDAHWMIVMSQGKVLEAGRQADLMSSGGWLSRVLEVPDFAEARPTLVANDGRRN